MHRHCWHLDDSSRRKYKPLFTLCILKCKIFSDAEYMTTRGSVKYKIDEFCCICGKRRVLYCEDYLLSRAMDYPTEEEYKEMKHSTN